MQRKRAKKGQAAIEFLTTYSWAIMGILLTIGALTYFDVFNTNRFISERCETGAQISCVEAAMTVDGNMSIKLANNFPVNITINRIILQGEGTNTIFDSVNEEFSRGQTQIITLTSVGGSGISYSTNRRETFITTIVFQRTDGTNEYNITGNIVVRPLPTGLI
ncbi:MAG: hypothetical protein ACLFN8_02700 [Candidatus Woesearchaeota archaeon]